MKRDFHGSIGWGLTFISRTRRAALSSALSEKYGFPTPMYEIAKYISKNPGVSQDAVTDMTRYDKATVARDAQKLEQLGYLRRVSSDRDRRQYELYLTDKGEALAEDVRLVVKQWYDKLTQGLSQREKELAYDLISRMANNVD